MHVKSLLVAVAMLVFAAEGRFFYNFPPPLLLAEHLFAVDEEVTTVPLVLMAQDRLQVVPVRDAHIAGYSHTRPLVTLLAPDEPEVMPAVQVALPRPIWVSEPEVLITFPSAFTVVHDGICVPIPVGAVIAPVPAGTYISHTHPIAVSVVYAIPTGPLPPQYPLPYPTRRPNVTDKVPDVTVTAEPEKPQLVPEGVSVTAGPEKQQLVPEGVSVTAEPEKPQLVPEGVSVTAGPEKQQLVPEEVSVTAEPGKPQLITVLEFPSTVQTPPVLIYQPPTDSELENRNPPQGVVPAGIVQSAAPTPNLSVFINSKESALLQELRDQANRLKASRT